MQSHISMSIGTKLYLLNFKAHKIYLYKPKHELC